MHTSRENLNTRTATLPTKRLTTFHCITVSQNHRITVSTQPTNANIMPNTTNAKMTNSDESAPAAKKTKASSGNEKAAPPPKKKEEEKRAKLYRTRCPIALQERLERAATQRLYLIQQSEIPPICNNQEEKRVSEVVNFTVLGSTGNVYTVVLGLVPSCTCPDYSRRQDMCKHIMFVLLKVIGLEVSNPLAYQKAYVSSELNELYTILRTRRVGGTILANDQVRAAVVAAASQNGSSTTDISSTSSTTLLDDQPSSVQRRSLLDDSDCPICFDDLTHEPESKVTFCRGTCGANFHEACIRRWLSAMTLAKPSCPHCRQLWVEENGRSTKGNPKIPAETTYTNLGSLQGLSHVRDSSTYSSYKDKKRRYY